MKKFLFLFFLVSSFLNAFSNVESENKILENKIIFKFEKILGESLENIDIHMYNNQANVIIQYKNKSPKNKEIISENIVNYLFKNEKDLHLIYIIITENSENGDIVYTENFKKS